MTINLDDEDMPKGNKDGEFSVEAFIKFYCICSKCGARLSVFHEHLDKDYGEDEIERLRVQPCNCCLAKNLEKYKEKYLADFFVQQSNLYKNAKEK